MNKHPTNVDKYFEQQRKDAAYRAAYDLLEVAAALAPKIKALREEQGLTQAQMAALLDTKQSRVSQMEDPLYARYTLLTLVKVADILGHELDIQFKLKQTATQGSLGTTVISQLKTACDGAYQSHVIAGGGALRERTTATIYSFTTNAKSIGANYHVESKQRVLVEA